MTWRSGVLTRALPWASLCDMGFSTVWQRQGTWTSYMALSMPLSKVETASLFVTQLQKLFSVTSCHTLLVKEVKRPLRLKKKGNWPCLLMGTWQSCFVGERTCRDKRYFWSHLSRIQSGTLPQTLPADRWVTKVLGIGYWRTTWSQSNLMLTWTFLGIYFFSFQEEVPVFIFLIIIDFWL